VSKRLFDEVQTSPTFVRTRRPASSPRGYNQKLWLSR
jgi:hypothetical protein